MKKWNSRILSLALALGLCLSLMPAASAAGVPNFPAAFQGEGYYLSVTPYEFQGEDGWYIPASARGKRTFHDGLIMVWKNVKEMDEYGYYTGRTYQRVGYADLTGKVVLTFDDWEDPPASPDPTYDAPFSGGLARYYEWDTGLYGYLNTKGEKVIPAQYAPAFHFSDGVARVKDTDGEFHFIDETGNVIREMEWCVDNLSEFGEGMAAYEGYMENGDYFVGFVDKQGQPAITIFRGEKRDYSTKEYLSVSNMGTRAVFSDGYAVLWDFRGGRTRAAYVVIDAEGNQVGVLDAEPPAYVQPMSMKYSEGLIFVKLEDTGARGGAARPRAHIWTPRGTSCATLERALSRPMTRT